MLEYCVLDILYQSQTHPSYSKNGWTDAGCHTIAKFLCLSTGTVKGIFDRTEAMGFLERLDGSLKRTTAAFYDVAYLKSDEELAAVQKLNVQKMNGKRSETKRGGVQKMNGKRSENELIIEEKEILNKLKGKPLVEKISTVVFDQVEEIEVAVFDQIEVDEEQEPIVLSLPDLEKEKSCAKKEKGAAKKPKNDNPAPTREMWEKYEAAFLQLTATKPIPMPKEFVSLAAIWKVLEKRVNESRFDGDGPATQADVMASWEYLLREIPLLGNRWLNNNFKPCVIYSQLTSIFGQLSKKYAQANAQKASFERTLEEIRTGTRTRENIDGIFDI